MVGLRRTSEASFGLHSSLNPSLAAAEAERTTVSVRLGQAAKVKRSLPAHANHTSHRHMRSASMDTCALTLFGPVETIGAHQRGLR